MEQSVVVSETEICIRGSDFIGRDWSVFGKEHLLDIFATYYKSQKIKIYLIDGENAKFSGFATFIYWLGRQFNIPADDIIWDPQTDNCYDQKLGIFLRANDYISDLISCPESDAKFVGLALGRCNPTRLRLAYETDMTFPNDNFTIFKTSISCLKSEFESIRLTKLYAAEIGWFESKNFDTTTVVPIGENGTVDWKIAYETYFDICNRYQIEIISETDAMRNLWFTEKTARCLAIGKPFVLVAGQASLQQLRTMGFNTFGAVIDESYDNEVIPTIRIQRMIASLQELYTSNNKEQRIKQLYEIAETNIKNYKNFKSSFDKNHKPYKL